MHDDWVCTITPSTIPSKTSVVLWEPLIWFSVILGWLIPLWVNNQLFWACFILIHSLFLGWTSLGGFLMFDLFAIAGQARNDGPEWSSNWMGHQTIHEHIKKTEDSRGLKHIVEFFFRFATLFEATGSVCAYKLKNVARFFFFIWFQ